MKFNLRLLSTAFVLIIGIFASPLTRANGTIGSGGGSLEPPNFHDISQAIEQVQETVDEASDYLTKALPTIKDPELHALFIRMTSPTGMYGYGRSNLTRLQAKWSSNIDFKFDGPCIGDDGKKEASTQKNNLNANICFSFPEIQKNIPKVNLESSLFALYMHEKAHQFGADESLARKVEAFFSTRNARNIRLVLAHLKAYKDSSHNVSQLRDGIQSGVLSDPQICFLLGKASEAFKALEANIPYDDFHKSLIDDEKNTWENYGHERLLSLTEEVTSGYCNIPETLTHYTGQIAQGDRKALKEYLDVDERNLESVRKAIIQETGIDPVAKAAK